jgi:hypothetical protein
VPSPETSPINFQTRPSPVTLPPGVSLARAHRVCPAHGVDVYQARAPPGGRGGAGARAVQRPLDLPALHAIRAGAGAVGGAGPWPGCAQGVQPSYQAVGRGMWGWT